MGEKTGVEVWIGFFVATRKYFQVNIQSFEKIAEILEKNEMT